MALDLVLLFLRLRFGSAIVQTLFLLCVFVWRWRKILDFRRLFPLDCCVQTYRDRHPRDVIMTRALDLLFIWDGVLYLAEWGWYFREGYRDIMLATHHALTICIYCWIVTFRFYNGYILLPLLAHQWVVLSPNSMSYLVYTATYFVVFVSVAFVILKQSYMHFVEKNTIFNFGVLCLVHILNLTEFGMSTRGVPPCRIDDLLAMYLLWGLGGFAACMAVVYWTSSGFEKTQNPCCFKHEVDFQFLYPRGVRRERTKPL